MAAALCRWVLLCLRLDDRPFYHTGDRILIDESEAAYVARRRRRNCCNCSNLKSKSTFATEIWAQAESMTKRTSGKRLESQNQRLSFYFYSKEGDRKVSSNISHTTVVYIYGFRLCTHVWSSLSIGPWANNVRNKRTLFCLSNTCAFVGCIMTSALCSVWWNDSIPGLDLPGTVWETNSKRDWKQTICYYLRSRYWVNSP